MILVDIYVPLMEKTFDFTLDETAPISVLIDEVSEIICQHERWPRLEDAQSMVLCCQSTRQIFPKESTLAGMGVTSGYRLMLL